MKSNTLPKKIAVIHLPALPGSPLANKYLPHEAIALAGYQAIAEAKILIKNGFDGIIIENFGDMPFYKNKVPPETIASMAVIGAAIRELSPKIKLGINILRNDASSALAVAAVIQADFIRVNILSGVSATDQGWIESEAAFILRERDRLNANHIHILADVHVKHAITYHNHDLEIAIEEVSQRGLASGVIITGETTGRGPSLDLIQQAVRYSKKAGTQLYIGSGCTDQNIPEILKIGGANKTQIGMIIGSALRKSGQAGKALDTNRIKKITKSLKQKNSKK